jgi:hypothetical protein
MGGRGAAGGVSDKGLKYGTEYTTIISVDNIKFVQPTNPIPYPVPKDTMSFGKNRVYAYMNAKGQLKSITFYGKTGKKRRQIDLDHKHHGKMPHVHIGYEHSEQDIPLTKSDKSYIAKIERIWRENKK